MADHILDANDVQTGGTGSFSTDDTYGTTYLREFTSFPSSTFASGSNGVGQIDVTFIMDMSFSTTDTGCILDQGGVTDGTYIGMDTGGNLRMATSGAVSGVTNETSTTVTDISAYAGVSGELIVTIDYQNHIQCWWYDSTNGLNQLVSVDYNGNGDWAGANNARVGQAGGTSADNIHDEPGGSVVDAFTGTITRYRELDNNYVDLSTVEVGGPNETSNPVLGLTHVLDATNSESTSETGIPVISQLQVLTSTGIESSPELTVPIVSQLQVLTSIDIESSPELTVPVIGLTYILGATNNESTSEIGIPVISQLQVLTSIDVDSSSELTAPVISQVQILINSSIEALSEITVPVVWELGPVEEDTRFTVYIPEQNTNVIVDLQDYTNQVIVPPENRQIRITA